MHSGRAGYASRHGPRGRTRSPRISGAPRKRPSQQWAGEGRSGAAFHFRGNAGAAVQRALLTFAEDPGNIMFILAASVCPLGAGADGAPRGPVIYVSRQADTNSFGGTRSLFKGALLPRRGTQPTSRNEKIKFVFSRSDFRHAGTTECLSSHVRPLGRVQSVRESGQDDAAAGDRSLRGRTDCAPAGLAGQLLGRLSSDSCRALAVQFSFASAASLRCKLGCREAIWDYIAP